tara:strand:- start:77 stop:451 length:375 start_codon:yes stop_codon:yes gene_type:complete
MQSLVEIYKRREETAKAYRETLDKITKRADKLRKKLDKQGITGYLSYKDDISKFNEELIYNSIKLAALNDLIRQLEKENNNESKNNDNDGNNTETIEPSPGSSDDGATEQPSGTDGHSSGSSGV